MMPISSTQGSWLRFLRLFWLVCSAVILGPMSERRGLEACFRGTYYAPHRRDFKDKIFVVKEYQPQVSERSTRASGPLNPEDMVDDEAARNRSLVRSEHHRGIVFETENARWMTEDCLRRLEKLSSYVDSEWPNQGVRVVVTRAWEPAGVTSRSLASVRGSSRSGGGEERAALSEQFHGAGRAVDITVMSGVGEKGTSTLGGDVHLRKLATLARYYAGFDWCFYTPHGVIHCSVKRESMMGLERSGCFHGNSLVDSEMRGPVRLRDVSSGERIRAVSSTGELVYSPVLFFLHRDHQIKLAYITLTTESGRQLVVTRDHLVYTVAAGTDSCRAIPKFVKSKAVFAGEVLVGDWLFVVDRFTSADLVPERVINVAAKKNTSSGAYAPLTDHGSVVVNGIAASSYSHVQSEFLGKFALAPYVAYHRALNFLHNTIFKPSLQDHPTNQTSRSSRGLKSISSRQSHSSSLLDNDDQGVHWYAQIIWTIGQYLLPSRSLYLT